MPATMEMAASLPPEPVLPLSIEQYHSMLRSGIIDEDSRIELLEGWLVPRVSKNPPHTVSSRYLRDEIEKLLPADWHVRCEQPVTLGDSEPEPDIAVVRQAVSAYAERHPVSADIGLVAEVANATLDRDRTTKKRLYARAGLPCYWLLDLTTRRLFVWSDPAAEGPDYRKMEVYEATGSVALSINGVEHGQIRVAALLP